MKKAALLVVGLVLFSLPLFSGEYLMNDTGETVYGLRVVFSEPVELSGFGDVLMAIEPAGKARAFTTGHGIRMADWDTTCCGSRRRSNINGTPNANPWR
jgi:hypothetical protein